MVTFLVLLVLWGGRNTANKYHWCGVGGGVLVVSRPHWVCLCAFLVYTAQAPGCSAGQLSKVGPELHALPRSKLLRFRFSDTPQRRRLGWACVLCPSQVRAAQVTRCLASALSPGGGASYRLPIASPIPAPRFPGWQWEGFQWEPCLRRALCLLWGAYLWL